MPEATRDSDLRNRFLEELSQTLDVGKTIKKLNITGEEARDILRGLITHKKALAAGAFQIYTDGASRGNPGEAGAGAVIKDPEGRVVRKLKKYLGVVTNNMAEYQALIMALEAAHSTGLSSVRIYADSELMVKHLTGEYRVKSPELKPLYERVMELLGRFEDYRIKHVYREDNSIADGLANEAIDGRGGR